MIFNAFGENFSQYKSSKMKKKPPIHAGIALFYNPRVKLRKNIPASSFNKLWPIFEDRPWQQTFTANSLTILHRETFVEYCEWTVYRELFFSNRLQEMF